MGPAGRRSHGGKEWDEPALEPAVSLQGSCPAGGVEGEAQQTWLEPQGGSSTPGEGQGKAGGQGAMLRDHLEACDQGSLGEGLDRHCGLGDG